VHLILLQKYTISE